MSKNPSAPPTSEHPYVQKRLRRKVSKTRLPTPPPDPTTSPSDQQDPGKSSRTRKLSDKDAEIFEYLESLQKEVHPALARSTSVFAPAIAAEDAFDHLEKLYKLMEQMLALREQNAKLHRRVRDLEHFRNLQNMHKHMDTSGGNFEELSAEPDSDSLYAERLLEAMLLDSKKEAKSKIPSRLRQSILRRQRHRSSSMAVEKCASSAEFAPDTGFKLERRASTPVTDGRCKSKVANKVSKWTKVKAAFKWERASATVDEGAVSDGDGLLPLNCELARYLRVPSTNEEPVGTSVTDSGPMEVSTPGTISLCSSMEDLHGYGGNGRMPRILARKCRVLLISFGLRNALTSLLALLNSSCD